MPVAEPLNIMTAYKWLACAAHSVPHLVLIAQLLNNTLFQLLSLDTTGIKPPNFAIAVIPTNI